MIAESDPCFPGRWRRIDAHAVELVGPTKREEDQTVAAGKGAAGPATLLPGRGDGQAVIGKGPLTGKAGYICGKQESALPGQSL